MREYSKPRHIWRALWPVLAFLGFQIVGVIVLMIGTGIQHGIEAMLYWSAENAMFPMIFILTAKLALFLPLWQATKKSHLELNAGEASKKLIALTVGLFLGLNLLLSAVFELTRVIEFFPGTIEHHEVLAGGSLIVQIVVIGLLAPIVEELCFRGVVLNRLNTWMPTWAAVLISSIVFGLVHIDTFQILYATLMGLILAWSYIRTKNLWIPTVGHIVFNMTSVLLGHYMEVTGAEMPSVILIIPSAVLTVLCVVLMQKMLPKDE